jgi:hypothetical protein
MLGNAVLMDTAVGETVDIPPTTLTRRSCHGLVPVVRNNWQERPQWDELDWQRSL